MVSWQTQFGIGWGSFEKFLRLDIEVIWECKQEGKYTGSHAKLRRWTMWQCQPQVHVFLYFSFHLFFFQFLCSSSSYFFLPNFSVFYFLHFIVFSYFLHDLIDLIKMKLVHTINRDFSSGPINTPISRPHVEVPRVMPHAPICGWSSSRVLISITTVNYSLLIYLVWNVNMTQTHILQCAL